MTQDSGFTGLSASFPFERSGNGIQASWSRPGLNWVAGLGRSLEDFGAHYVSLSQAAGEITDEVDAWREAGGTDLSVVMMGLGLDSVDDHIDYLASIANALNLP